MESSRRGYNKDLQCLKSGAWAQKIIQRCHQAVPGLVVHLQSGLSFPFLVGTGVTGADSSRQNL